MSSPAGVSDFPVASTPLEPTDVFYLVRAGDFRTTIAALFSAVATPALFTDRFGLGGTPQTLTNSGAILSSVNVTLLTTDSQSSYTIEDGAFEGQLKIVIAGDMGSEGALSGANVGVNSVVWSEAGHAAVFIWINDMWRPISGTANIIF